MEELFNDSIESNVRTLGLDRDFQLAVAHTLSL